MSVLANQQHVEWFIERLTDWNQLRETEPFKPDLSGCDLNHLNLSNIDLSSANLANAVFLGAWLNDAQFEGADLSGANLRNAKLVGANLVDADLSGADLTNAKLDGSNLSGAKLYKSELTGARFDGATLTNASFSESSAKTSYKPGGEGIMDTDVLRRTDFGAAIDLDQSMAESMFGDSLTKLPPNIQRPAGWPEFAGLKGPNLEALSNNANDSFSELSVDNVQTALSVNRYSISLLCALILEQIAQFREVARTNNQLAVEAPTLREELFSFLDEVADAVSLIAASVPSPGNEVERRTATKATGYLRRLKKTMQRDFAHLAAPENLGTAVVPTGIVLSCAALGSMLGSAAGPTGVIAGFGVGSYFGRLVVNNLKPGEVTKKVEQYLEDEQSADGEQ